MYECVCFTVHGAALLHNISFCFFFSFVVALNWNWDQGFSLVLVHGNQISLVRKKWNCNVACYTVTQWIHHPNQPSFSCFSWVSHLPFEFCILLSWLLLKSFRKIMVPQLCPLRKLNHPNYLGLQSTCLQEMFIAFLQLQSVTKASNTLWCYVFIVVLQTCHICWIGRKRIMVLL